MARTYLVCVLLLALFCLSVDSQGYFNRRYNDYAALTRFRKGFPLDFGYGERNNLASEYHRAELNRKMTEDPYGPGRRRRETGA